MKKFVAWDYEDILQVCGYIAIHSRLIDIFLQCAIPAFKGLLPEPNNTIVTMLLFCLVEWHALAKLRLHTEPMTLYLRSATITLGKWLCEFR